MFQSTTPTYATITAHKNHIGSECRNQKSSMMNASLINGSATLAPNRFIKLFAMGFASTAPYRNAISVVPTSSTCKIKITIKRYVCMSHLPPCPAVCQLLWCRLCACFVALFVVGGRIIDVLHISSPINFLVDNVGVLSVVKKLPIKLREILGRQFICMRYTVSNHQPIDYFGVRHGCYVLKSN